jgi:peptide subunit release factor 1 (eRF1)
MITRDQLRELAAFQCEKKEECAISFYFQPQTPKNKAHREEAILVKDLVRDAILKLEKNGKTDGVKSDLNRILELAEGLHGNAAKAKAVFACAARGMWHDFDLPASLPGTQLVVNQRFHLNPLAPLLGAQPRSCVVLVDRLKARIFDLRLNELTEREGLFQPSERRGRSEGFAGYDGGHAQRRIDDEILHHFRNVAEHLREAADKGIFDALIVGCSDVYWSELQVQLHPYVQKRLAGHFSGDVMNMSPDEIRDKADQNLKKFLNERRHNLIREVMSQAKSNSRGVTGLRRVLRSMEQGEVQTLLIQDNFAAPAVECLNCGHIDAHIVKNCPLCGRETRHLGDVLEAIVPAAIRKDIELFYVRDDEEFERGGKIAALLRFRADQTHGEVALAS